jgi:hypothetical protein
MNQARPNRYQIIVYNRQALQISNMLNDLNAFNVARGMIQNANSSILHSLQSIDRLPNICNLILAFKMLKYSIGKFYNLFRFVLIKLVIDGPSNIIWETNSDGSKSEFFS